MFDIPLIWIGETMAAPTVALMVPPPAIPNWTLWNCGEVPMMLCLGMESFYNLLICSSF